MSAFITLFGSAWWGWYIARNGKKLGMSEAWEMAYVITGSLLISGFAMFLEAHRCDVLSSIWPCYR